MKKNDQGIKTELKSDTLSKVAVGLSLAAFGLVAAGMITLNNKELKKEVADQSRISVDRVAPREVDVASRDIQKPVEDSSTRTRRIGEVASGINETDSGGNYENDFVSVPREELLELYADLSVLQEDDFYPCSEEEFDYAAVGLGEPSYKVLSDGSGYIVSAKIEDEKLYKSADKDCEKICCGLGVIEGILDGEGGGSWPDFKARKPSATAYIDSGGSSNCVCNAQKCRLIPRIKDKITGWLDSL